MFAAKATTAMVLSVVLTLYFLLEGRDFYAWLVSYVPRRYRKRVAETASESSKVVMAYMRGQVITCALCGIWVYAMLMLLHVPAALPLAAMATIADIIPVVGTIIMTLPGVAVAFIVTPLAAFEVLVGYCSITSSRTTWSFRTSTADRCDSPRSGSPFRHHWRLSARRGRRRPGASFRRRLPDHRAPLARKLPGAGDDRGPLPHCMTRMPTAKRPTRYWNDDGGGH